MEHPYWPLFDLRVTTPRLQIRLPTDADLFALVTLADEGVHDPATMPFSIPWTDVPAPRRHGQSLQWWWSQRATWQPDDWTFTGAVFVDGEPVGVQNVSGESFGRLGVVSTGSWLGRAHQGKGIGTEMRAAILHLAFDGLGAREAHTEAFMDTAASLGVSRALGYVENGRHWALRRGRPDWKVRLTLDREAWAAHRRDDISIEGLARCRDLFSSEAREEAEGVRDLAPFPQVGWPISRELRGGSPSAPRGRFSSFPPLRGRFSSFPPLSPHGPGGPHATDENW